MVINALIAQEAAADVLVGWWMALIFYLSIIPWAWLVSSKLDKDARFFHLNAHMWNSIHLGCLFAAILAMVFIPLIGVSWLVGVIIMWTPIFAYWKVRNDSVPEDKKFHLTSESLKSALVRRKKAKAASQAMLTFSGGGKQHDVPTSEDPLFAVHMSAEDLIGPALMARASRVEVLITPKGATVSQLVDGVRVKRDPMPAEDAMKMVTYLKSLAGMDVSDPRRRQIAKFKLEGPTGSVELNAMTYGSSNGLLWRMDFDRAERLSIPFDGLGLLPNQLKALRPFEDISERHGLILIGAPAGQGLSTTAYSFLDRHDAYTSNIKALEYEVQLELEGTDQITFDTSNPDAEFGAALQTILRRDPDIVLTDVIDSTSAARVAVEPGMQGPLIYVQQRQGSIGDQIREWVKLVGDIKAATRGLRAVTNQRLIRTLCNNCRQPYTPSDEQIQKLGLKKDQVEQLFRASGKVQVKNNIIDCPVCNGTGYLGQTGVFEVMVITDEIRKQLTGGDLKAALALARRNNMIYLQEAALTKVASGMTTIEEIIRVTAPPRKAAAQASQQAGNPTPQPTVS